MKYMNQTISCVVGVLALLTTGWSDRKNYVTLYPVENGEYGVSMT